MTGINFAVGLYKKESWDPVNIDSYGYLEVDWTRYDWKKMPVLGSSDFKFDLKAIPIMTHSCSHDELAEKFNPVFDSKAEFLTTASRNMTCVDDLK